MTSGPAGGKKAASARGHEDLIAIRLDLDLEAAGAREQAGVERLDRVRVDRSALRGAFEQRRHRLRDAGIEPRRGDAEAHALALADRIDGERAAARNAL